MRQVFAFTNCCLQSRKIVTYAVATMSSSSLHSRISMSVHLVVKVDRGLQSCLQHTLTEERMHMSYHRIGLVSTDTVLYLLCMHGCLFIQLGLAQLLRHRRYSNCGHKHPILFPTYSHLTAGLYHDGLIMVEIYMAFRDR